MEPDFLKKLMELHENKKKKGENGRYDLSVDSVSDGEDSSEAHIHINGSEDFRLEIEEVANEAREIRISVYRDFSSGSVHSSINCELDLEEREGAYYDQGDDAKGMSMEEVYGQLSDLLGKMEKIELD